jgi:hypothetical protein
LILSTALLVSNFSSNNAASQKTCDDCSNKGTKGEF